MDEPDLVEKSKPKYINWSAKITVFLSPAFLYEMSTSLEISFLLRTLLIFSNPTSTGVILHIKTLPTVVSCIALSPFSLVILTFRDECISKVSVSNALRTSSGSLNTLPFPIAFALSLVM